ncbi:MAG: hypothetical protein HY372_02145, partial [Candidatus Andersenbacteria bacterium]|nr:hypothetical protein [Candidatus Andersenbacteria bacterium]
SGFHVGHLNHVNFYVATMVLPYLLVAIDALVVKPTLRASAILALAAAVVPLSGHAQIALYTLIIAALYGLVRLLYMRRPPPQHPMLTPLRQRLRRGTAAKHRVFSRRAAWVKYIVFTLIAGLLALSLASFAILPLLELLPESDRAAPLLKEELYEFSYPPAHTITLLLPYFYGNHATYWGAKNFQELAAYVGPLPLLLAGLALFSRHRYRAERIAACMLIAISLLLAPGSHSPLYRFLVEHEYLTSLAIPSRFVFFFDTGISLLAALGTQALIRRQRLPHLIALPVLIVSAATLVYYGWQYNPLTPATVARQTSAFMPALQQYLRQTGLPARLLSRDDLLREVKEISQHATNPISPKLSIYQRTTVPQNTTTCFRVPLYSEHRPDTRLTVAIHQQLGEPPVAEQAIAESAINNTRDTRICFPELNRLTDQQIFLSLSATSPIFINAYFKPTTPDAADRAYFARVARPTIEQLVKSREPAQLVFTWERTQHEDPEAVLLSRHLQSIAGASSAQWINAFAVGRFRRFAEKFLASDDVAVDGDNQHFLNRYRELINMSGITHLIQLLPANATDQMLDSGFTRAGSQSIGQDEARLYTNPAAYPKAFLAPQALLQPDTEAILATISQPDYQPRQTIYVQGLKAADFLPNSTQPPAGTAVITSYQPTEIIVEVNTPRDALLVLTDTWTRQWHAQVDNQPAPSLLANTVFRATPVPAGAHTVTFYYRSPAVARAKILTTASLLLVSAIVIWPRRFP